jgi:hypothetical protein
MSIVMVMEERVTAPFAPALTNRREQEHRARARRPKTGQLVCYLTRTTPVLTTPVNPYDLRAAELCGSL